MLQVTPCDTIVCGDHGSCETFGREGRCVCVDGFVGVQCQISPSGEIANITRVVKACPNNCMGHGVCNLEPNPCFSDDAACVATCACFSDYHGPSCGKDTSELRQAMDLRKSLIFSIATASDGMELTESSVSQQAAVFAMLTSSPGTLQEGSLLHCGALISDVVCGLIVRQRRSILLQGR